VIERLRSPRAAGGRSPARAKSAWTALALGGLLVASAASSDRLLEARVARRYEDVDLPYDRQLRKSEMVRRAAAGLERTSAAGPRRIALYMPSAADRRLDQRTGRTYSDTAMKLDDMLIVRVLDGGRALRAVVPGLDSVAFVRHWSRDYAGFDLCANSREGDIEDFGRGPDAHLLLGERLIRIGRPAFAVDLLVSACEIYPGDNRLRAMLDQARTAPARR